MDSPRPTPPVAAIRTFPPIDMPGFDVFEDFFETFSFRISIPIGKANDCFVKCGRRVRDGIITFTPLEKSTVNIL